MTTDQEKFAVSYAIVATSDSGLGATTSSFYGKQRGIFREIYEIASRNLPEYFRINFES